MLKKMLLLLLALLMVMLSTVASAQISNKDMQLMGGILVSNANDSFFFAPLEQGMPQRWALYSLSACAEGYLAEVNGYPARLVHADDQKVYFLAYTDANRSVHALFELDIASKEINPTPLLADIATAFVESDDKFLYVSVEDPYMLCRYDISTRTATELKSMKDSKKTIYDACVYNGDVYFITKSESGSEDTYLLNSNNKANNENAPKPELYTGVLHNGYRLYTGDKLGSTLYAVAIGKKNGVQLGAKYKVGLNSLRYGSYLYTYNPESNEIIAISFETGDERALRLDGESLLSRLVISGSADEIYYYYSGAVYQAPADLSSSTKLFNFDSTVGGTNITHVVPAGPNAIAVMGYNGESSTNAASILPTNVYLYNRADGEMIFGFPAPGDEIQEFVPGTGPIGDIPTTPADDGETYFYF